MNKIVPAFQVSLFDQTLSDACSDIIELGIDSILNNDILQDIPIANTIIGVAKTAKNIHDRNLLRQTIKFIKTFNAGCISKEKIENYKKLLEDPKKAENELGRVLIILDSFIDLEKSELLAKLYCAYVYERITWEEFCEFSDVVTRLFIIDIPLLHEIFNKHITETTQCFRYQQDRLVSLGLLNLTIKSIKVSSHQGNETDSYISLSQLGKIFCEKTLSNDL